MKDNLSKLARFFLLTITVMIALGSSLDNKIQTVKAQPNAMQTEVVMDPIGNEIANSMHDANDINGTVSISSPIIDLYKSKIQVSLIDALQSSVNSVDPNSSSIAAFLHSEGEYLVYKIYVLDSNNNVYVILVDVGNGEILSTQKMSFMEMMMELHGNDLMIPKHQLSMMGPDIMGLGIIEPSKGFGDPMTGHGSDDVMNAGNTAYECIEDLRKAYEDAGLIHPGNDVIKEECGLVNENAVLNNCIENLKKAYEDAGLPPPPYSRINDLCNEK